MTLKLMMHLLSALNAATMFSPLRSTRKRPKKDTIGFASAIRTSQISCGMVSRSQINNCVPEKTMQEYFRETHEETPYIVASTRVIQFIFTADSSRAPRQSTPRAKEMSWGFAQQKWLPQWSECFVDKKGRRSVILFGNMDLCRLYTLGQGSANLSRDVYKKKSFVGGSMSLMVPDHFQQ
ncbi:uncharacterized protein IWZ02DRAFT_146022 [Phyllosticta citriasiana]|uniref:uncharacterized protein n=1 Tax=Phyllosticta citriasiana TaxID=595635 RepID=UPI0030FD536A